LSAFDERVFGRTIFVTKIAVLELPTTLGKRICPFAALERTKLEHFDERVCGSCVFVGKSSSIRVTHQTREASTFAAAFERECSNKIL